MTEPRKPTLCPFTAQYRRFWPGKEPDLVCLLHALASEQTAKAIGMHLHLETIDDDKLSDDVTCDHAAEP